MSEIKLLIGRLPDCDVVISDESVSKKHAEIIEVSGGRLLIRDIGSTNGTVLIRNGKSFSVKQDYLYAGDEIVFGDIRLRGDAIILELDKKKARINKSWNNVDIKMVRCSCGAIKPYNGKCKICG